MKRFLKWAFLTILIILVLVQIPFIYRRYQTGKLAEKINSIQANRTEQEDPRYKDLKGVVHVHTNLGGHSTARFEELLDGAKANGLDFVLMTEHVNQRFSTAELTLNGVYDGTLFIGGNETDTADDRFLLVPGGTDTSQAYKLSTPDFIQKAHSENRLAFITYPEKHKTWDSNFDGVEVFSLHTAAKGINPLPVVFDAIWSFPAYPDLTFGKYLSRPDANLQKFDEVAATRRISMFAGIDAHSNLGFHLLGDDAGGKIINLKFDRFATIFRMFRVHLLHEKDKPLTRESLIATMKNGHYYTGFDTIGDSRGFMFSAESGGASVIMGDELTLAGSGMLRVASPVPVRFVVFRNGEKFGEATETSATFEIKEKGSYRVEAYQDGLGAPFDKMPWVLSNPIFVR